MPTTAVDDPHEPAALPDRSSRLAAELLRHRLDLHVRTALTSVSATATAASALVFMLWGHLPSSMLLGWLAVLLAVLGLRLGLGAWQRRQAPQDEAAQQRWLTLQRASFALHGTVWFGLAWLVAGTDSHWVMETTAFIMSAMVGGALVTASFDALASWLFAGPVALGLFTRLFRHADNQELGLVVVALMFVAIMGMAARRGSQQMVASVAAGVDERARYQEARRYALEAEQARQALAEQHDLLQQLIRETPQGYWFIDPEGRTLDVNPAMCALLGRSREEILKLTARDVFTGPERAVMDLQLARRQQGQVGGYEIDVVRPDGTRRHAFNQATPIHDRQGRRLGSIGLWTDLTDQKAQAQELRTYERVTNSISDMVCVIGPDRRLRLVNDAWCERSGQSRERALGSDVDEACLDAVDAAWRTALEACMREGRSSTVVQTLVLPGPQALDNLTSGPSDNLQKVTLQTSFYPYRDSDNDTPARSVILVSRDITSQERDRAAVETSAAYLRRTLNATGEAIFASDTDDPNQPVRFANEQVYQLWGLNHDPNRPLTPAMIMGAAMELHDDPVETSTAIREVIRANRPHEARVRLRDGRVLFRRCEPAWIDGRWLRVWSFRDITAEETSLALVTQRESEQRALLSAFPGYIAVCDEQYRYVFINDRLAALHGVSAQDILGRTIADVLGEDRFQLNLPELLRAAAGEIVRSDRSYPAVPGRPALDLEVTHVAGPATAQGRQLFYSFGIDITERRRSQEALAAARDEAERANQAKSQFLSHMSHELRTPMNAIVGFAQLLKRDARPALAAHQLGYAKQILRGAQHLLELINEILDLSRIEADRLPVNPSVVPLSDLAADCLAFVGELARDHQVQLRPSVGLSAVRGGLTPTVWADARRLRQVLLNLLGNAIKYNQPGGHVQLVCIEEGPTVRLEVHDSGSGIHPSDRDRLFMPFERLQHDRSTTEGTGIGLALSKRLIEAMGGEIDYRSVPDQGSCFWLRIPACRPSESTGLGHGEAAVEPPNAPDTALVGHGLATARAAEGPQPTAEAAGADVRLIGGARPVPTPPMPPSVPVLYIDDNEVNLLLVETLLTEIPGLRVLTTSSPEEGLRLARIERPRLVLLDIHMPVLDGYAVLARLRADPVTAGIPVVAVSADAQPSELDAAQAAGFSSYLTKPLDLERLLATVRRLSMDGVEGP